MGRSVRGLWCYPRFQVQRGLTTMAIREIYPLDKRQGHAYIVGVHSRRPKGGHDEATQLRQVRQEEVDAPAPRCELDVPAVHPQDSYGTRDQACVHPLNTWGLLDVVVRRSFRSPSCTRSARVDATRTVASTADTTGTTTTSRHCSNSHMTGTITTGRRNSTSRFHTSSIPSTAI